MQTAINMTVKLNVEECQRLKDLAAAKNRTAHFLMKEAIKRYIEDEEAEQKAIQIAAASIAHYQQTGLHVTLDEVKTWTKTLKTNREAKIPTCHE